MSKQPCMGSALRHKVTKVLLGAVLTAMIITQPAGATAEAEMQAVAGPGGFSYGYLTSEITISKGDSISFTNLDAVRHDIVHDVASDGFGGKKKVPWCKGKSDDHGDHAGHGDACPVFWSETIPGGARTEVLGLKRVKPGQSYTFFCTVHHNMKGTLIVRD